MATKNLAKQLGLIRRSSVTSLSSKNPARPKSKQFFDYLIIIDFESTCWRDTKHYGQEIIEFPAVLINTTNGQVESEFHTYVQPQEHPILSEFCTELTGIKQDQVEEGIPLKICLSQFCSWIQRIQTEKKIMFISATSSNPSPEDKLCAFVTWSDWDLEVCLLYECKRKQLRKPDILNSWIDLRATYKNFYNRKPKGLNGALQDLGIAFSGREHSGLDDSRNTARLAWRMICDGCMIKITKSLDKVCPKMNPAVRSGNTSLMQSTPLRNGTVAEASSKSAVCDLNFVGLRCHDDKSKAFVTSSETRVVESEVLVHGTSNSFKLVENGKPTEDHCSTQSLLSPQTLINGLSVPFGNRRSHISSCNSSMNLTSGIQIGKFSSTLSGNSSPGSGLVLVSTTISSMNSETDSDMSSSSECLSMLSDWEDVAVIKESEDLVVIDESGKEVDPQRVEQTASMQMHSLKSIALKSPNNMSVYKIFDHQKNTKGHASSPITSSVVYKSPTTTVYNVGELNKRVCSSFKLPELVSNYSSSTKPPFSALKASKPIENDSVSINKPTFKLSETMANKSNHFTPVANIVQKSKSSTLLPYFPKRKISTTQFVSPLKKQPFTIYKDIELSSVSLPLTRAPPRTPSSSFFNSINANQSSKAVSNSKVTPPLCNCGRRSRRLTVSSMGPNQGRAFYCCPVGKRVEGKKKSCGFFKWDQTIIEKPLSPFIAAVSSHSHENSVISSNLFSSSPKRSLCLRPSMRM